MNENDDDYIPFDPEYKIVLTSKDFDAFMHVLNNPPEPNEKLKEAFENHKKLFGKKE